MDLFHRVTAALATGAIALAIPVSSLALGLGLGVQSHANATVSAGSTSSSVDADADADAKIEARCAHLSDTDHTQCETSVRAFLDARGDSDARVGVRAIHGKLMSTIRHRMHDVRKEGREMLARVRVFLSDLRAQLHTALNTEAELALQVCKDKEGDEQEKCFADAKVKLQSKVNAAIEAMKK